MFAVKRSIVLSVINLNIFTDCFYNNSKVLFVNIFERGSEKRVLRAF